MDDWLCILLEWHRLFTVLDTRSPRSGCQQVWFLLRSLILTCNGCLLSFVFPWTFLCECASLLCLLRKPGHLDEGPILITSFKLNYLYKVPVGKLSHFLRHWGHFLRYRASAYEILQDTVQSITSGKAQKSFQWCSWKQINLYK